MASGKKHNLTSMAMSVPSGILVHALGGAQPHATGAIVGCLAGTVLSPDLDIIEHPGDVMPESVMRRVPVLGELFRLYWIPYGFCIPHRHMLSHAPVLGTFIRLLYLSLCPTVVLTFLAYTNVLSPLTVHRIVEFAFSDMMSGIVLGLALSDLYHWVLDGFPL